MSRTFEMGQRDGVSLAVQVGCQYRSQLFFLTTAGARSEGISTTILEAIAYALFDYLPYRKEDFLKRGTKKGVVRVTFVSAVDGRDYTVTRDTGTGYFVFDPITKGRLVEQKGQVTNWIREHLGVDAGTDLKALFTSSIGVPQGTFIGVSVDGKFVEATVPEFDEKANGLVYKLDTKARKIEDVMMNPTSVGGLLPALSLKQAQRITALCKARLPDELVSSLQAREEDPAGQVDVGVEHCVRQCEGLLKAGVPGIHFYVLNRSDSVARIMANLGLV